MSGLKSKTQSKIVTSDGHVMKRVCVCVIYACLIMFNIASSLLLNNEPITSLYITLYSNIMLTMIQDFESIL